MCALPMGKSTLMKPPKKKSKQREVEENDHPLIVKNGFHVLPISLYGTSHTKCLYFRPQKKRANSQTGSCALRVIDFFFRFFLQLRSFVVTMNLKVHSCLPKLIDCVGSTTHVHPINTNVVCVVIFFFLQKRMTMTAPMKIRGLYSLQTLDLIVQRRT